MNIKIEGKKRVHFFFFSWYPKESNKVSGDQHLLQEGTRWGHAGSVGISKRCRMKALQ